MQSVHHHHGTTALLYRASRRVLNPAAFTPAWEGGGGGALDFSTGIHHISNSPQNTHLYSINTPVSFQIFYTFFNVTLPSYKDRVSFKCKKQQVTDKCAFIKTNQSLYKNWMLRYKRLTNTKSTSQQVPVYVFFLKRQLYKTV